MRREVQPSNSARFGELNAVSQLLAAILAIKQLLEALVDAPRKAETVQVFRELEPDKNLLWHRVPLD